MTMALLPLLICRCPCCYQAGIVALVTMALLPLIRNGFVALDAMALSLSSSWHCCPCCNGVIAIIDVVALVACHQVGIIAVDAQAFLSLLRDCCSSNCVIAIINAQGICAVADLALLLLSLIVKLALSPSLQ
jgi:hypothetical protein